MGKHSTQFVVMVTPRLFDQEVMVGMPFVECDDAREEARRYWDAGNSYVRVTEMNPHTGQELPEYNSHVPLP